MRGLKLRHLAEISVDDGYLVEMLPQLMHKIIGLALVLADEGLQLLSSSFLLNVDRIVKIRDTQ